MTKIGTYSLKYYIIKHTYSKSYSHHIQDLLIYLKLVLSEVIVIEE